MSKNPDSPRVVALAGPNGAGKSTAAKRLLLGPLAVAEFVNADTIAVGLSAFGSDRVAIEAGRVMLARLNELAASRSRFAFETTLAARSYAKWLRLLRVSGYEVHLVFLWLNSPELAIARVAERVASGGHSIPEATIRRRYLRGIINLRDLYLPIADSWRVIDSTQYESPSIIAHGERGGSPQVYNNAAWHQVMTVDPERGLR